MRRSIVLIFAAAALLMVAAVALNIYGREIFEPRRAAAEGLPEFSMSECYSPELKPWEKASLACGWLSIALSTAGAMLWGTELCARRQHVLLLGGVAQVDPLRLPRPHDDEGLTPLERVIRGY